MPQGPQAQLVLDIQRHWLGFMLSMITPTVVVDGRPMPGRWGRNAIVLPPGQHHLHVHLPYLLPSQIGPADLTIWLQPGMSLDVEYRAPLWAYSRGALGPPPQQWNGMGITIALMAIPLGLLAFLFLLIIGSVLWA
ncbi:hypothetical protein [Nonomuraea fuscirosea]|uniref:hypothetical protein n=1 Tax=Nonomuraea fuscirosea TaxID=1291556 RepID=UPI003433027D